MENRNYESMIQEYKRLLAEGRVVEANKLKFEIALKSLEGVI